VLSPVAQVAVAINIDGLLIARDGLSVLTQLVVGGPSLNS